MRLLAPEHKTALTDPQTWRDNPFVHRDACRDANRKQPLKSLAWMSGTLLVFLALALWGLGALHARRHHIPWYLGGDMGTALCIAFCGIHVWYVTGTAQKLTTRMLAQEAFRNTLAHLLMLPLSPFQMVLQAAVYPWLAAMRMAVLMLPVYAFFVGLDGVAWADVLMLYVVFALLAVSLPTWRRPALGDSVLFISPTQTATNTAMTAASGQTATTGAASPTGVWVMFACLMPVFALFFSLTSRRGGVGAVHHVLSAYIPDSLLVLLPTSMLSWPLLMARALITPFDWFGLPVPPLPFVLTLFALNRYTQAVRTGEYLSVGTYRDLALLPTYLPRRRLEGALRIAQAFVVTGYLWKWAIWNGGLAWAVGQSGGGVPGQMGFVYGLLFLTTYRGLGRAALLARWQRIRQERRAVVSRQVTPRAAARFLAEPFASAGLFYLACCAVSRTAPFPAAVCALAGKMLAVGLAGVVLNYGANRALGMLAALIGLMLPSLWIYGTLFAHAPEARPLAFFSPTLGLLNLSGITLPGLPPLFQPPLPWWMWAVDGGLTGLLLALCALLAALPKRPPAAEPDLTLDPTLVGEEAFYDRAFARTTEAAQVESPVVLRLIAGIQRCCDNAVIIKELRARLRGKLHPQGLRTTFVTFLIASVAVGVIYPPLAALFESGLAPLLFGPLPAAAQPAANMLSCWHLLLLFVSFASGFAVLPLAFAVEREKSTLGFLLMTPMSARSIVFGKLIGLLVPGSLGVGMIGLWTLALSLLLTPTLGLLGLLAWLEVTATALAILVMIGMGSLAVASLFPRTVTTLGSGLLAWILFQACLQSFIHLPRALRHVSAGPFALFGLHGYLLWLGFLGLCLALTLLMALLSIWGVRRMRKGDIAFAASKREN